VPSPVWADYLTEFHDSRPGVTEAAFLRASDSKVGTPYDWLTGGLGGSLGDVVDLACGNAAVLPRLAPHASYVGVDRSQGELAEARRRGRGPVVQGDLLDLPLRDASADVVVSSMGLMLVQPAEQALREVHRILRPGGRLALLLPAPWPLRPTDVPRVLRLSLALRGPGSMPQQLRRRRLRRSLEAAGLRVESLHNRRFPYALDSVDDAQLAVRALYTPGRTARRLAAAERLIVGFGQRRVTLPVPLLRVLAYRPLG
jgi:SAM-dependent methyltransferase